MHIAHCTHLMFSFFLRCAHSQCMASHELQSKSSAKFRIQITKGIMTNCVKRSMNCHTNVVTTIVISFCFMATFFYPLSEFSLSHIQWRSSSLSIWCWKRPLIADSNDAPLKTLFIIGNEHSFGIWFSFNKIVCPTICTEKMFDKTQWNRITIYLCNKFDKFFTKSWNFQNCPTFELNTIN